MTALRMEILVSEVFHTGWLWWKHSLHSKFSNLKGAAVTHTHTHTHTGNILTTAERQALQRATCTISLPTLFSVRMERFALMSNQKSNQCVLFCSKSSLLWQTHLFQKLGSGTRLMTKKARHLNVACVQGRRAFYTCLSYTLLSLMKQMSHYLDKQNYSWWTASARSWFLLLRFD